MEALITTVDIRGLAFSDFGACSSMMNATWITRCCKMLMCGEGIYEVCATQAQRFSMRRLRSMGEVRDGAHKNGHL